MLYSHHILPPIKHNHIQYLKESGIDNTGSHEHNTDNLYAEDNLAPQMELLILGFPLLGGLLWVGLWEEEVNEGLRSVFGFGHDGLYKVIS